MFNKVLVSIGLLAVATFAVAKNDFPAVSHDGLHLMPDTKLRAVYMKPGADLSEYDKVYLVDAYVAFAKNWKRDHNNEEAFDQRINDKQMKEIRERVAKGFAKEFTEVLSTKGGHQVVTEGGEGVLVVRPAIVNLDVTAPDLMSPETTSVVASAGSMTLYMELYDGKTQAIIARVIDPEAADNAGLARVANRVTNTQDFERVIRRWAEILNSHLAAVKK